MKSVCNKKKLKEQRLQELLSECQNQALQQIIGPFGLSPEMFKDKDGGNVTTTKNFEQGITANEQDQKRYENWSKSKSEGGYNRTAFDAELPRKRKEMFKTDEPIYSKYTGKELTKDGRTHLDHVVAAKTIETNSKSHLYMTDEQRVSMANQNANLVAAEGSINQSMQDKDKLEWAAAERKADKGKTNAQSFGVDEDLLKNTDRIAKEAISADLLKAQITKQGQELLQTGAKEAGKVALRQAFGVLLYEFVNGTFIEIKYLFNNAKKANIIDELFAALKRVSTRVISKLKDAGNSAVSGSIQGFISNLLTFLINNLIKTSAKVVSIIRESIKSVWQAIKLLLSPPKDLNSMEITKAVIKILTITVATSLGMFFEESIQAFLMSIPLLMPLAGLIAPAITGVLTGICTAILVYGIDRIFDWLSEKGTELVISLEDSLDSLKYNIEKMASWIEIQYNQSQKYTEIAEGYTQIQSSLAFSTNIKKSTLKTSEKQLDMQVMFNNSLVDKTKQVSEQEQNVKGLLDMYELGGK